MMRYPLYRVLERLSRRILPFKPGRAAFLGLSSSCVSDVCSNSLRVIKTNKQTAGDLSYRDAVTLILEEDMVGLFGIAD